MTYRLLRVIASHKSHKIYTTIMPVSPLPGWFCLSSCVNLIWRIIPTNWNCSLHSGLYCVCAVPAYTIDIVVLACMSGSIPANVKACRGGGRWGLWLIWSGPSSLSALHKPYHGLQHYIGGEHIILNIPSLVKALHYQDECIPFLENDSLVRAKQTHPSIKFYFWRQLINHAPVSGMEGQPLSDHSFHRWPLIHIVYAYTKNLSFPSTYM